VDDFLVEEQAVSHFFQLKSDATITWGRNDDKLTLEFAAQGSVCDADGRNCTLTLVVADRRRRDLLDAAKPAKLGARTSVVYFQPIHRATELAHHPDLSHVLPRLRASRHRSLTEDQHCILALQLAWLERPNPATKSWIGDLIAAARTLPIGRIQAPDLPLPNNWPTAQAVLHEKLPLLEFWVDRGYFEWQWPPADQGMLQGSCTSEEFRRFLQRITEAPPDNFEDFYRMLP
jgi:hypothetical protein